MEVVLEEGDAWGLETGQAEPAVVELMRGANEITAALQRGGGGASRWYGSCHVEVDGGRDRLSVSRVALCGSSKWRKNSSSSSRVNLVEEGRDGLELLLGLIKSPTFLLVTLSIWLPPTPRYDCCSGRLLQS